MATYWTQVGPRINKELGFNYAKNITGTDREGKPAGYNENSGEPLWVVHAMDKGKSFGFAGMSLDNPYIIGWGLKIADAYWTHADDFYGLEFIPDGVIPADLASFYAGNTTTIQPGQAIPPPEDNFLWIWTIELEATFSGGNANNLGGTVVHDHPLIPSTPYRNMTGSNQLTTFDTWGRIIPYSKGSRRLPGAKLWALGVEGGEVLVDTAFGSWAEAFGYPLHPGESIYANKMWFDGQEVWTAAGGWNIAGLDDASSIAAPVVYYGSETQTVDPNILADKGPTRTPAFLGLIYIVYLNIPLNTFGNRRPGSVDVEFLPTDGLPISVADALVDVGVIGDATIVCVGMEGIEADGVVFANGMNPRQIIQTYQEQYGYVIIDGDPIQLVLRGINDDFAVDDTIEASDFVDATDDVALLERADPSTLLAQITINHPDMAINYQVAPQYARLPIFPVRISTAQNDKIVTTDFIISAVTALSIAYDMLYRDHAEGMTSKFALQPWKTEVEEGDVLSVPTSQGQFALQVTRRAQLPDLSVDIESKFFLTESGAALSADSGDILTTSVIRPYKYPGVLENWQTDYFRFSGGPGYCRFIVSGEKIVCGFNEQAPSPGLGLGLTAPDGWNDRLFISSTNILPRLSARNAPVFERNANNSGLTHIGEDQDYYYSLGWVAADSAIVFARMNKLDYSDIDSFQTAVLPSQCFPEAMVVYEGSLYVAANGADGSGDDPFLARLNLSTFSDAGMSYVELTGMSGTGLITPSAIDLCGAGGFVFVSAGGANSTPFGTIVAPDFWKIFRFDTGDGSLDSAVPTFPQAGCVAAGDKAYFLPFTGSFYELAAGFDNSNVTGVMVDPVTFAMTDFDISDNTSVHHVRCGQKPWADETYLYFLTNNDDESTTTAKVFYVPTFYNAPYLARRLLSDVSSAGGKDLTFEFDNTQFTLEKGAVDGSFHYIKGRNSANEPIEGRGCILKMARDFTWSLFYPPQTTASVPINDDFPGITILVDTAKTYKTQYASKEFGEPDHSGAIGERSVWYRFTPLISGIYRVTVTPTIGDSNQGGGGPAIPPDGGYNLDNTLVAIYSGASFDNLVEIANNLGYPITGGNFYHNETIFPAEAGITYKIAVDSTLVDNVQHYSTGTIVVSRDPFANDDFADATTVTTGSTETVNITYATKEPYEPDHAGNPGGHSVWYKFVATNDNTIRFDTGDSEIPTVVAVYTGSTVDNLTEIDSASDSGGTDDDFSAWIESLI